MLQCHVLIDSIDIKVIDLVILSELESADLIKETRTDIVRNDIDANVVDTASRLVFIHDPRPVDKLILLKLVMHVLKAEVRFD